jgi:hypothetical protein
MFTFTSKKDKKNRIIQSERIETWFKERFNKMSMSSSKKIQYELDDIVVSISQIKCVEPDCPPLETVIAILDSDKPLRLSIQKCLEDVNEMDVVQSIQDWIDDKVKCNCGDVILQAYKLEISRKYDTSELLVGARDVLSTSQQEATSNSTVEDIDRMIEFASNKF